MNSVAPLEFTQPPREQKLYLIRRGRNRTFYDPQISDRINSDRIVQYVAEGKRLLIVDVAEKDVTGYVLAQVLATTLSRKPDLLNQDGAFLVERLEQLLAAVWLKTRLG